MEFSLKKRNLETKYIIAIMMILIYSGFTFLYKNEISPAYSYRGFFYTSLGLEQHLVVLLFLLLPLTFLPIKIYRPSSLTLWFLYAIPYSSTCFMLFYCDEDAFLEKIALIVLLVFSLFLMHLTRFHRVNINLSRRINWLKMDTVFIFFMFAAMSLLLLYLLDFKIQFHSPGEIYNIRLAARETNRMLFQGYFFAIATSVITIMGVYLFVFRKKVLYLLLTLLINFSVFSFQATKISLIIPVILIGSAVILKRSKEIVWFLGVFLTLIFLATIEWHLLNTPFLSELFVRRVSAVPGFLNIAYYDYFSAHPKVLMTDSVVNFFIDPVYPLSTAQMIGLEYFDNPLTNADAGIWMTGFAHFGYPGTIAVSCVSGFLLGLLDNLLKTRFFHFGCLVCVYLGIIWAEQGLHTSFLSGGVFYIFIVIFFILASVHTANVFCVYQPMRREP